MAGEALVISLLCGILSLGSFNNDCRAGGLLWTLPCAAWAILCISRLLP